MNKIKIFFIKKKEMEYTENKEFELTCNGILSLFKLELSKQNFDINIILQIIHLNKNQLSQQIQSQNSEMYTACLSDEKYSYNRFVFCKESESPELKEGELILIKKISPMKFGTHPERVFLIKEYQQLKILQSIRIVTLIKDNPTFINELLSQYSNSELSNLSFNPIKSEGLTINNKYTPIKCLTTFTKEFILCGKVIYKSDKKTFSGRKCSQLFSFVIEDEEKKQIELVGFDKTVDIFYNLIKEGNTYEIEGGYVKINDNRYYNGTHSEYKIILNENSNIKKLKDGIFPKMEYVSLNEIFHIKIGSIINVLCIVYDGGEVIIKNTKSGEQVMKKVIILDKFKKPIELTLWREFAKMIFNKGDILELNKIRVSDFNGRNLNTFKDTKIEINPTFDDQNIINQIQDLKSSLNEYVSSNPSVDNKNLVSNQNQISQNQSQIKINNTFENYKKSINEGSNITKLKIILEKMDDEPDKHPVYKIKATISKLSHNDKNYYPGCTDGECQRKLTQDSNGWRCTGCGREYSRPNYFYSLNIKVKDCSCEYWIDLFGKTAEYLMQVNANDYRTLLMDQNEYALQSITNREEYQEYYFYLKPKFNNYNGIIKKKLTVTKIEKVNEKEAALNIINKLNKIIDKY